MRPFRNSFTAFLEPRWADSDYNPVATSGFLALEIGLSGVIVLQTGAERKLFGP